MLFTSPLFLLLLFFTFGIYYLPFLRKQQIQVLIVSSLIFYAYHTPTLLLLFLCSVTLNTFFSYRIYTDTLGREKQYATWSIAFNLLLLSFFKYNTLLFGGLTQELLGGNSSFFAMLAKIPLPIGISFYTFEGISLVVDVLRDKKVQNPSHLVNKKYLVHFKHTLFFISFFPHLIAGPILKAQDFYPQIGQKKLKDVPWDQVFQTLVMGYFLKMVVADNLKDQTFWLTYPYFLGFSTFANLVLLLGYSMQIFADFAGYSLISIGLAALFGYSFPANFNFPYISQTFAEFWRRWHISLSTWLREYLYIPLGGNRRGKTREYVHLMIVMFLGGLWHGGAWSYAVWGSFHGLALAIERACKGKLILPNHAVFKAFKMVTIFLFVTYAWLLFKLPHFEHVIAFTLALADNVKRGISFTPREGAILLYSLPVLLYHLHYLTLQKADNQLYSRFLKTFKPYLLGLLLFLIFLNSGSHGEFIYFQF